MAGPRSDEPRSVRFVDVSSDRSAPGWMPESDPVAPPSSRVSPLTPPEVPSHPRPDQSPIVESLRPPGAPEAESLEEAASRLKKPDTLIEELIPRADEEAVVAIEQAIVSFARQRQAALGEAEKELVSLLRLIARRILLRELTLDPGVLENVVRDGLSALGQSDRVTIKLGPFFEDAREELERRLEQSDVQCRVVMDGGLGPYGCTLETQLGRVDESLDARLAALLAGFDE